VVNQRAILAHDIHALILGQAQAGLQAFAPADVEAAH
jgi:hypothetical protein